MRALILCLTLSLGLSACFGAVSDRRKYFVLHPATPSAQLAKTAAVEGSCRVTTLDSDAAYGKFQVVVRKSPFEIRYSETKVWAARPAEMVADGIAEGLQAARVFDSVRRRLGDSAPTYTLSGNLIALELYDSDNIWFAHLALRLQLTRFKDGARLWSYEYDSRQEIKPGDFGHGARALSELLREAYTVAAQQIATRFGHALSPKVLPEPVVGEAPAAEDGEELPAQISEPARAK